MALQVEIEFGRVNYVAIHNGASRAIPAPIRNIAHREESNVMAFSNNNNRDLRRNTDILARR